MRTPMKTTRVVLAGCLMTLGIFGPAQSATDSSLQNRPNAVSTLPTTQIAAATTMQIITSGERSIFYNGFQ
jgi:hypothetical protein